MRKTYFKKSLSLIMAVLMVLSTWVFFVSPVEAEAANEQPYGGMAVAGQSYVVGKTDKYGTPMFDGNLDRWFKFSDGGTDGTDWIKIKYPSHIYLDKSETLQSAGYFWNVDWEFGSNTNYRFYLGSMIWGDYDQSGSDDWATARTYERYNAMANAFSGYSIDASLPKGAPNGAYPAHNASNCDVRVVGYDTSQGSDGFWNENTRHNKFLLWKSNGKQSPEGGTIFLKGTPKSTGTWQYSTAGYSFDTYGWQQNWDGSWGEDSNTFLIGKGGNYGNNPKTEEFSNYGETDAWGTYWLEMGWDITIYDKSALNEAITSANSYISNTNYTLSSRQRLQTVVTAATNILKTRNTTQTALDAEVTKVQNAINALEWVTADVNYDNLFSFSEWARVTPNPSNGSIDIDVANGSFHYTSYTPSTETNKESTTTPFRIDVKPDTEYTVGWTSSGEVSTDIFVFRNNNVVGESGEWKNYGTAAAGTNQKGSFTFKTRSDTTYITLRFDCNGTEGDSATISNVWLAEKKYAEAYNLANRAKYRDLITAGSLMTPAARPGYSFAGWYKEENFATQVTSPSQVSSSTTLYSKWNAIDVNYDNLFSLAGWASQKTINARLDRGTVTADIETGEVKLVSTTYTDDSGEVYTPHDANSYTIPVVSGETYIFEADIAGVDGGNGFRGQMYISTYAADGTAVTGAKYRFSTDPETTVRTATTQHAGGSEFLVNGRHYMQITIPTGCSKVAVRIGAPNYLSEVTYSNIAFYKASNKEVLESITNREYRINTPMSGADLYTPERVGYIFKGWYYDEAYTQAVSDSDTFSANTTVYAKWNLYPNDINYENLFSFSDWANSPNSTYDATEMTGSFDVDNGTITVAPISGGPGFYLGSDKSFYHLNLTPGEKYVLEFDVSAKNAYVAVKEPNGATMVDVPATDGNDPYIWGGAIGTRKINFTAPEGGEVGIAFAVTDSTSDITYSNIRVYKKADEERLASYSGLKVRDVITDDLTLNVPTMVGYQFEGWYKNEARTDKVTNAATLENSTTVYSNWTPNNYTIAFNGNGGSYQGGNLSAVYDTKAVLPATGASRTGYTFSGWNTQADGKGTTYQGGSEVLNLTNEHNGVVTLYAMWTANTYTIVFDGNGNTSGATASQTVSYGTSAKLTANGFVKDGYTFNGWTTKKDGSGTKYANSAEIQNLTADVNGSITLYAQWKVNNYTVTFSNNGGAGVMDDISATYDVEFTLAESTYTKTGYTFDGWNTKADGSGEAYANGATVKNLTTEANGTVTLYAQWKVGTYEVIFNPNGGDGDVYSQYITYDQDTALTANTFTREGYIFAGWNTASGGNGSKYADGATVKNLTTTSITLFAQWTAVEYKIVFDGNGNDGGATADIDPATYDNPVNLTRNGFTKTGYTFSGWNTQADGKGKAFTDQESVVNLASGQGETATLYAQWAPNTYTIKFGRNGGSIGNTNNIIATYDAECTLTLNGFNRAGYTFTGWNTEADGSGTAYSDGATVKNLTTEANDTVILYAQWQINTYTVTWVDGNGEVLKTETLDYGTTPAYAGATPTKTADKQYTYTFNNKWSPAINTVSADVTYTAQFNKTVNEYTIEFVNEDGTVLQTGQVEYGETPVYEGATPTKAADKQYTYTFNTWEPAITSVTDNATYKATYNKTVNKYEITWVDGDGKTLKTDSVDYGTVPVYVGETPTRTATAEFTYTFKGWDTEPVAVTGDAVYTADFDSTVNKYTVKFVNDDGTLLSEQTLEYGKTPAYAGATPTKAATAEFTYTFKGWDKEIATVTGDVTYTAEFNSSINSYTIKFVDEDGATVLSEQTLEYGKTPVYAGEEPTKQGDAEFTWTFAGWTPEVTKVTGDATYKATYTSEVNKYTVTWVDGDGNTLKTDTVAYGTVPAYEGATPTKTATAEFTYTFKGWKEALVAVTGDATYNADFDSTVNQYTVTFVDEDSLTILDKQTLDYGATPKYKGATPTKAGDAEFTWTFAGWDKEIATVTGDAVYTATYTSTTNTYTVTWLDENGDELEKDEAVAYGTLPTFDGEEPTKQGDAELTWTFAGWTPEVTKVTGDATYTATYTSEVNEYTVTWVDGDGNTLKTDTVAYGTVPAYEGATPTKTATAEFTYTFKGWDKEIAAVTGNVVYTAQFDSSVNSYTIKFVDEDGVTVLDKQTLDYGETPEYKGETPTKATTDEYIFTFSGWTPEIEAVTGDAIYTAVYDKKDNSYKITFVNEDGSVLYEETFKYGETPAYGGETPTKASDVQYDYTFAGWDKDFAPVASETTYTATYDKALRSYTITFVWAAGNVSKEYTLEYGSSYRKPANTTDWQTDTDHYTYSWPELPAVVTGEATYTEIETKTSHTMIYTDNIDDVKHTIGCENCPWSQEAEHSWDEGQVTDEANCTEPGSKLYTCADCGGEKTEEIPATGHTEETVPGYAAECLKDGLTDGTKCSVCGEVLVEQVVIPATGHADEDPENGYCDNCGEFICEHKNITTKTKEPTCTEKGEIYSSCDICNSVFETKYVDALGHDEQVETFEATCLEYAYTITTCSRCDELNVKTYIGNTYAEHKWVVIPGKSPTCVSEGYSNYNKCSVCDITSDITKIPVVPHNDVNGDGRCDTCGGEYSGGNRACGCICHKENFIMRIFYAIARLFWKLFKINHSCACGNTHY